MSFKSCARLGAHVCEIKPQIGCRQRLNFHHVQMTSPFISLEETRPNRHYLFIKALSFPVVLYWLLWVVSMITTLTAALEICY